MDSLADYKQLKVICYFEIPRGVFRTYTHNIRSMISGAPDNDEFFNENEMFSHMRP